MRMYALYERSRKVLALYITFAIALTAATLVSLKFSGISTWPHMPFLIFCIQCVILTRNKDNPGDLQMQLGCGMVASRKKYVAPSHVVFKFI